jgi:hypothetical protein
MILEDSAKADRLVKLVDGKVQRRRNKTRPPNYKRAVIGAGWKS